MFGDRARVLRLGAAGAVVLGSAGFALRPALAATPAVLSARQVADHVQPAVDLIESETTATLTIYLPTLDIDAVVDFAQNNDDIQNDLTNGDDAAAARAIITEIDDNVDKYIAKGDSTQYDADIGAQGSGFTVTPDGYVVTNAHIGVEDPSDAASQFIDQLPNDQLDQIQQSFIDQFGGLTDNGTAITIPEDQYSAVDDLLGQFIGETADVAGLTTKLTVFQGASSANAAGMDATLVTAGKPFPDKDVAILKVDGNDLPTVSLGDDTTLSDGDPVYAIGYPGDATFDKDTIKTTKYTSTISAGIVSNRLQSSAASYQYIEHTATMNHGNSGGALVDDHGTVVGITTAVDSSTEAENGVNGGKFYYAVPTSVVRDFLAQAHVTARAAPAQAAYLQGVDYIEQGKLSKARKKLMQAQSQGLNTPYLAQELALTDSAAGSGGGGSGGTIAAVAGGGVGLLVVAALILLLTSRRKRKRVTMGTPIPANASIAAAAPPAAEASPWTTPATSEPWNPPPAPAAADAAPAVDAAPAADVDPTLPMVDPVPPVADSEPDRDPPPGPYNI